jgi:NAD(P)-dependent dehydrogenase (short-subunit alcohol dehydrogenase family)
MDAGNQVVGLQLHQTTRLTSVRGWPFNRGKIMKIHNSIAFVTGANRGLGLAVVHELLARGAKKVYAGVRNPSGVAIPGAEIITLDVTDPASVASAAAQCMDTTILVNNAGIARITNSTLGPEMIDSARELLETNFYGLIRTSQAFAPALTQNGGGAIVNVLSDASWVSRPMLAAYSATKSAAWSFTNALRVELRKGATQVLAIHVGFMDTDMTTGLDIPKASPTDVSVQIFDALEAGEEEVLADEGTRAIKLSLAAKSSLYLNPPEMA